MCAGQFDASSTDFNTNTEKKKKKHPELALSTNRLYQQVRKGTPKQHLMCAGQFHAFKGPGIFCNSLKVRSEARGVTGVHLWNLVGHFRCHPSRVTVHVC